MGLRLDGRNSLSYLGVKPASTSNMSINKRRPTSKDVQNFNIGDFWVIPKRLDSADPSDPSEEVWMLMGNALVNGFASATWKNISVSNPADLQSLTGNNGPAVFPDTNHNINLLGVGGISTSGNSGTNTVTISGSSSSLSLNIQTVSTAGAGTYTPTAGMAYCIVECIGGGGAGGSGASRGSSGGGAGGYCRKVFSAADIGTSQAYVVGSAGTSGTAGGNTTFGSFLIANGGQAGTSGSSFGGAGGGASGGDVNIQGQQGSGGIIGDDHAFDGFGGNGGNSVWGLGGPGKANNVSGAGVNGAGYGAGGGGSLGSSSSSSGSVGAIIITEYIA